MTIGPISTIVLTVSSFVITALILFLMDRGFFKAKIVEINGTFFVRKFDFWLGWRYLDDRSLRYSKYFMQDDDKFIWWPEDFKFQYCIYESIEQAEESYQKYLEYKGISKKPKIIKTL